MLGFGLQVGITHKRKKRASLCLTYAVRGAFLNPVHVVLSNKD